jgi:hypothetical protein
MFLGIFLLFSLFCNSVTLSSFFYGYILEASGRTAGSIPNTNVETRKSIEDRMQLPQEASKKLREVRGETEPGQYIVVLKSSTSNAKDTRSIADESRADGIEVRHL